MGPDSACVGGFVSAVVRNSERPILFGAAMVRALRAGRKTQTRRMVKPQPSSGVRASPLFRSRLEDGHGNELRFPYGQRGDRLWVREAYRLCAEADAVKPRETNAAYRVWYEADAPHQPGAGKLRPGIFMPRWASRITLEIVDAGVGPLHSIDDRDAIAEGVERVVVGEGWRRYHESSAMEAAGLIPCETPRASYRSLWDSINGPGSWEQNPWVWMVDFVVVE